jgi:hypothetical protein
VRQFLESILDRMLLLGLNPFQLCSDDASRIWKKVCLFAQGIHCSVAESLFLAKLAASLASQAPILST